MTINLIIACVNVFFFGTKCVCIGATPTLPGGLTHSLIMIKKPFSFNIMTKKMSKRFLAQWITAVCKIISHKNNKPTIQNQGSLEVTGYGINKHKNSNGNLKF